MNTVLLNTVHLDGAPIIKKVSGEGGGSTILNQSKSVDIVENGTSEVGYDAGYTGLEKVSINVAIPNEEKTVEITENGTTEVVAANGFLSKVVVNTNVASSGGGSGWTGHADVEGLKAIGWTDEDIAYYQENGVNWNEEDDEYHKVTDDNKALYGVLTADNIQTYKDRIVYLPKIDTSGVTEMNGTFSNCYSLVAIPKLDTSNVTNMSRMFYYCYSLKCVAPFDMSKVTSADNMFNYCYSLVAIPMLDTSKVTSTINMFGSCYSLVSVSLDMSNVTDAGLMFSSCSSLVSVSLSNTSKVGQANTMFYKCISLAGLSLDARSISNTSVMLSNCYSLIHIYLKNVMSSFELNSSPLLSKESLLYLINNEAATSAITIMLAPYAYERLANDADVVAALNNHPNISISK